MSMKNPVTLAGIEPATFRFVAQHLNHCATAIPCVLTVRNTGLSKKMDGIWNRYSLKSTGRIYTFGILKCSEKFKVLDLP